MIHIFGGENWGSGKLTDSPKLKCIQSKHQAQRKDLRSGLSGSKVIPVSCSPCCFYICLSHWSLCLRILLIGTPVKCPLCGRARSQPGLSPASIAQLPTVSPPDQPKHGRELGGAGLAFPTLDKHLISSLLSISIQDHSTEGCLWPVFYF